MGEIMNRLLKRARQFLRSERGNVAMMFGIALVPMIVAAGVGLDYARGVLQRSQMTDALDAAALAVGSTTGLDQASAQALAQKYFNANYAGDTTNGTPNVTVSNYSTANGTITINATYDLPTTLLKVIGQNQVGVNAAATVVWGQSKLWVSLVLDNSGSMSNGDSSGSKMTALKNASHQLLTILQNAATNPGDVKVSVVPFDRIVNVGTSNVGASWIDWTDWEAPPAYPGTNATYGVVNPNSSNPATVSFEAWGPGDGCPFTNASNNLRNPYGFKCQSNPTNGGSTPSTIPSSGTYKGYICPGMDDGDHGNSDHRDRYYNGCYTSTKVTSGTTTVIVSSGSSAATCNGFSSSNCGCTGSNGSRVCKTQRWTHAWVVNNHSTWAGCIMDRDKTNNYDISNTPPSTTPKGFPAMNMSGCLSATVTPLGYDWSALGTKIDAMSPNNSTNQAIGMAHGWQTLTNSDPYNPGAVPTNTSRYIIILSDGLNTQDRWWGNGSTEGTVEDGYIDDREKATCDAAKAEGVIIYSIFLNVGGGGASAALSYCATDSTKYFVLTTTSAVVTTFNQIAQQITNVRVSR